MKADAQLVELDVAGLGQRGPARDVGAHELAELLGRHRHRLDRLDRQLLAQVGRVQHGDLRVVELLHHVGRHAGRARPTPYHCCASKPLKPDSSSVGTSLNCGLRARAGDRQRPHAAGADVRQRRRQAGEHRLRLAADQVGEGRRDAAVGDVHHEGTDLLLEQLHRQVRQRALAGRAVADAAGVLLQVGDELLQRLHRQRALTTSTLGVPPIMPTGVKSLIAS